MRIVHIANFYGPSSGGIKTTLHALGKGYLQSAHEFIYIVPGPKYIKEQTPFGTKITLPSITLDRKSTRLNSSHVSESRMPSSA